MSEWVQTHLPCPCGQSSDAYSINDKGWGKCFSCGKNFNEAVAQKVHSHTVIAES
jgi:twinkle protein